MQKKENKKSTKETHKTSILVLQWEKTRKHIKTYGFVHKKPKNCTKQLTQ